MPRPEAGVSLSSRTESLMGRRCTRRASRAMRPPRIATSSSRNSRPDGAGGKRGPMATLDYDVVIIGSGFGGSVAALRAAEKGYRVGVMEAGKRWKDEDIPKTQWDQARYLWLPAAEL